MKQYAKRCLAWALSIAMAVTVLPATSVQAEGETIGTTQTINCGKFVRAGGLDQVDGTDGKKAVLIAVSGGGRNEQGSAEGAAMIAGETGSGGSGLGSGRVAAMGFELPKKKVSNGEGDIDPELISHAEVSIVVNKAHNNLGTGNTKAAIFQVASEKYDTLTDGKTPADANFPAKDGYTKDKTKFSGGLGGDEGWITTATKDQKLTFDVTDWIKESINAGDTYAVYRLQTANGGWYVYQQDAGDNAPKLSITTLTEEDVFKQVKADIKIPSEARSNFTLPTQGVLETSIAWASSDDCIKIEDGRAVVTRPTDADKEVTLTATLSRKEKTDTATYKVKVAKKVFGEPWVTFDFNSDAQEGKFTSNGVEAVISGTGTGAELKDRDEANGKALYLDGSAKWLSLQKEGGESLLTGLEELTVSFDAKPDRTGTNWGFYAAPNANAQAGGKEQYIGALIKDGKTTIERYKGGRETGASAETGAEWCHVDVVFTEDGTSLYVNGVRGSFQKSANKLSDILGASSICQLGKANWGGGEYYQGWIDNFKLYDHALTPAELCSAEEIERMVAADKEALTIDTEVKADFDLPVQGENGSDINWTVAQNDCIKIEGNKAVVTRPQSADQTVALTAEIAIGQKKETKVFQVKVIKSLNVEENIQAALAEIELPNQNDVRDNLTLPTEVQAPGETQKVTVTWESKNKAVITDSKSDNKEAGMVTRPASDTEVELVATGHIGESTGTRTIKVQVKAKKEMEQITSYLFAHFTGTEGRVTDEQIYFATSENGSQWLDMTTNGNPVLDSSKIEGGDGGVRDPFLLRSHNGDKFWMIATDLSIFKRGGWGSAQATSKGSTKLVIWESTDLVNWDEPRLVDIASKIPGAGCAWAPEAYYDPATGNYVVYWATASSESNKIGDRMNMYYCTTRDFHTFTEPVLWIDRDHSIIDTTMIYDDTTQTYYRASGDGQITIEKSKSIYDGWEIIGTLSSIFNNDKYSGAKLEGPEFFEYCQDDWLKDENGNPVRTWGLMCDQYSEGKGYLPFRSTDLADMSTKSWSPATDVNFGSLKKRHGTILPVTDAEYKAVMKKFGYSTGDEPVEQKVLADFKFDEETSFEGGSKGFSSENAKAVGNYTLKDSYSTEAGKALYLDGSNTNFLTVTDKDGKSLLSGAKELTISYEFKPDRTNTNWVMYAAPDDKAPTNNSERYLGILEKNGSTTLERYNNNGKRPTNPSVQTGNSWSRVDIVMTETSTTMYLNGQKISSADSSYKLPYILGASSIFQIGKANWGKGEYCKGWIDNLRIENKALTEAQVQALAADFVSQIPLEVTSATVGTAPDRTTALEYRGTDDHTAITSLFDSSKKEIQPYVRKGTDLTKIPVTFGLNGAVDSIKADGKTIENGSQFDLSKDTSITFTRGSKTDTWTIKKPIISNNPVLPGQYADPDIDYFDGKFWIYPTTDGFPSWSGTVFHAFSSPDMVNWTDEGTCQRQSWQE